VTFDDSTPATGSSQLASSTFSIGACSQRPEDFARGAKKTGFIVDSVLDGQRHQRGHECGIIAANAAKSLWESGRRFMSDDVHERLFDCFDRGVVDSGN